MYIVEGLLPNMQRAYLNFKAMGFRTAKLCLNHIHIKFSSIGILNVEGLSDNISK